MRKIGCWALCLCIASLLCAVGWWSWSYPRWQDVENRDPREVFRFVFRVDPPAGVREIKAAGHQPLDGYIWMRIRTDDVDGFIRAVGASKRRDGAVQREMFEPATEDLRRYAAQVGWESSHHVTNPAIYDQFDKGGYLRVMVVDRARGLIYVGLMVS